MDPEVVKLEGDELPEGFRSLRSHVPPAVPSVRHGSAPCAGSMPRKKAVPFSWASGKSEAVELKVVPMPEAWRETVVLRSAIIEGFAACAAGTRAACTRRASKRTRNGGLFMDHLPGERGAIMRPAG